MSRGKLAALAATVVLGGGVAVSGCGSGEASEVSGLSCFSQEAWDGADGGRPCFRVVSVEEDGSGRVAVGTVAGDLAQCVVPNVAEETGLFSVVCEKVKK